MTVPNPPPPVPDQPNRPRQIRPTLIVGLGGTGRAVLVRVKARFLETFGTEIFQLIKLVALDTDPREVAVQATSGATISLNNNTEFLHIGAVSTVEILQNLDISFPHIKVWLPSPSNLPKGAITDGAKMTRPLGRLAFFVNFRRIYDHLHNQIVALASIHNIVQDPQIRRQDEAVMNTNIILVSSICGGTGSGIFLDTAYLLRDLFRNQNISLTGILALPEVFRTVDDNRIKANAFAALRELDHFTGGTIDQAFDVAYTDENQVHSGGVRPFDFCYLVDGKNEQGRTLTGMNEFAPLIAESIFMQVSSSIGNAMASAIDNVVFTRSVPDRDGIPHETAFSGLGMASLRFPAAEIIDVCGRRFAARLITQGLLANQPSEALINGELDKLQNLLQLHVDQLLAAVTRDDQGKPLTLNLGRAGLSMALLEILNKNELLVRIAGRAQHFTDEVLNDNLRKQIDRNFKVLEANLSTQLDKSLALLLDKNLTGGLLLIEPLLDALRRNLSQTQAQLDHQRREQQGSPKRSKQLITAADLHLKQVLDVFIDPGGRRRKAAINALIEAHRQQFQQHFELMQKDCVMSILTTLIRAIEQHLHANKTLIVRLRTAAEKFDREDKERVGRWDTLQDGLKQVITNVNDIETFYEEYVPDVGQQMRMLVEPSAAGPVHTWDKQYPSHEKVSAMVLEFAHSVFAPIARHRLEKEVMRKSKREQVEPNARLETIIGAATPFWGVRKARMLDGGDNIKDFNVIGVEDTELTAYRNRLAQPRTEGTTTLDPHRITVLHTKHGVPIHALDEYYEYQKVYNLYIAKGVPLHIMPMPPMPDVKKARCIFALAHALGVIVETGVADYEVQAAGVAPIPLGKGLPTAVLQFIGDAHLVVDVEKLAEAKIASIGKISAKQMIDTYTALPLPNDTARQTLQRTLNDLILEYRQRYL